MLIGFYLFICLVFYLIYYLIIITPLLFYYLLFIFIFHLILQLPPARLPGEDDQDVDAKVNAVDDIDGADDDILGLPAQPAPPKRLGSTAHDYYSSPYRGHCLPHRTVSRRCPRSLRQSLRCRRFSAHE